MYSWLKLTYFSRQYAGQRKHFGGLTSIPLKQCQLRQCLAHEWSELGWIVYCPCSLLCQADSLAKWLWMDTRYSLELILKSYDIIIFLKDDLFKLLSIRFWLVKICGEGRFYYCFDLLTDLVPLLLSMGQKIQYLISMERGVRV